jgi:PTH1 family peptidyl-tRNA hydrolase
MKLIVGLGNPGSEYAANRHNVGFMCINHLARANGIKFDRKQGLARVGIGCIAGQKAVLAKPQTYMNVSGESVVRLVNKHRVDLADLIVIHDDLDLPLGKLRLSFNSSSGGHRGIKSIISALGSKEFNRVRIGIGRPGESGGDDIIDFVLGDLTGDERKAIEDVLPRSSDGIACLISDGLAVAMNKFN